MIKPIVLETGENTPTNDDNCTTATNILLVPFDAVHGTPDACGGIWATRSAIAIHPISISEDEQ